MPLKRGSYLIIGAVQESENSGARDYEVYRTEEVLANHDLAQFGAVEERLDRLELVDSH